MTNLANLATIPEKRMSKELICLSEGGKNYWQMLIEAEFLMFLFFPLQVFSVKVKYKPVSTVSVERRSLLQDRPHQELILNALNLFWRKSLLPLALSRGSDEAPWVNLGLWEPPPQYPMAMLSVIQQSHSLGVPAPASPFFIRPPWLGPAVNIWWKEPLVLNAQSGFSWLRKKKIVFRSWISRSA